MPTAVFRPDRLSALAYGIHIGIVVAPIYLTAWTGPGWEAVLCWVWFGVSAHGLILLLHECIHKLAYRNTAWNEALANWLLAPLFLADFAAFRRRHWAHHRALGGVEDPKYTYRVDIRGWRFVRLVIRALTLREAFAKMKLQLDEENPGTPAASILRLLVFQALFATSILVVALAAHPGDLPGTLLAAAVAYAGVYGYGIASLTPLVHTLRGVAEHRPCDDGEEVVGDAALRNFSGGFVERWIWGPYGFVDHATHHRFPALPAYCLPAATRERMPDDPTLRTVGSHTAVLWRLVGGQSLQLARSQRDPRSLGSRS
jgi:fatty acid desaturase